MIVTFEGFSPTHDFFDYTGYSMKGVVVDGTAMPITDATIYLWDAGGGLLRTEKSNPKGEFAFERLHASKYCFHAVTYKLKSDDICVTLGPDKVTIKNIVLAERQKHDLPQAAPPSRYKEYVVLGSVVDTQNRPVEGAQVTLVDPETNFKAGSVTTDSKGGFIFSHVIASKYCLQARKGEMSSDPLEVSVTSADVAHADLVMMKVRK
jgi:protocatechuate 3,4-dioxygenase beta subunit